MPLASIPGEHENAACELPASAVIKAAKAPLEAFVERALWCSFEHSGADCPDRLRADNKR